MTAPPGPATRVLVVEDEMLLAMDLEATLTERGYQVLGPVPTVAQALRVIEEQSPDAALLDINLGTEQVFPAADALARADTPFAFLSGYGTVMLPAQHSQRTVISKPVSPKDVIRCLDALLQGKEQSRSA